MVSNKHAALLKIALSFFGTQSETVSHAKISEFFACEQKNLFLKDWSKKNSVKDKNCWFYYLKIFWKFQILKKALQRPKSLKNLKNNSQKNFNFFWPFYTGSKNIINKKGLFYARFFEFEEFSIVPFF